MLTGIPPFRSTTRAEIHRKARNLDYKWPTTDGNDVCQEARGLVSLLLSRPEGRPDCDTIVQEPFFSCGWVPQADEMTVNLSGPNKFAAPVHTTNASPNLKILCTTSDVGPWSKTQNLHSNIYKEVKAENVDLDGEFIYLSISS